MEPWIISLGLIGLYLLFTMAVGVVANRKSGEGMEDFLLYGRQAGFVILYLTVVATYHSSFAFLGSSGFFYTHGIGFWVAGTWTVLVGAFTYTFGPRIWRLGKAFGYITPADLFADYFQSDAIRLVVAFISLIFSVIYIQVQAQGLGYIVNVASGGRISLELGTLILLTASAAYLIVGGLRAVYWTDALQGIWMYVAVWMGALFLTYKYFGGPIELVQQLSEQRPDLLTLPGPKGYFTYPRWFGLGIVLSFGVVLQPHLFIRYYTANSERTLRWLGATTPIYLMTLFIPAALIGLGGALIKPGMLTPDRIFPEMLFEAAPAWLTGIVLAGAVAAAMSTLDSILHANTTILTRDIYERFIHSDKSAQHYVGVSRIIIVALLIVGYYLSVSSSTYLVTLVTLSGAGALQLLPAAVAVLFPSRWQYTQAGILAGMATGILALYLTLIVWPHPGTMHGGVWALLVNWIIAFTVSRFTTPPDKATLERIHTALQNTSAEDAES